jgi:Ca2+-binding EF-hand superfamily protein
MKFAAKPKPKTNVSYDDANVKLAEQRSSSIKQKTDEINARKKRQDNTEVSAPSRPKTSASSPKPGRTPCSSAGGAFNPGQRSVAKLSEARSSVMARRKQEMHRNSHKDRESTKLARRMESLQGLADGAITNQVRRMARKSMARNMSQIADGLSSDGSAIEKLHEVMTQAKESGLSVGKIFAHFQGGNKETTEVSLAQFVEGLSNLGDGIFTAQEEEMTDLVNCFDYNGDGMVSLAEFKSYCYYQIPTEVWIAERLRLEESGGMLRVVKDLKADFERRVGIEVYPCGDLMDTSSKALWRTDTSLDVRLYYCTELGVITVQSYDVNTCQALPHMYVMKSDCAIQRGDPESEGKSDWELIAKYILGRLKLKQSIDKSVNPYLCMLSGDTNDSLMISKPINIKEPPVQVYDPPVTREDFNAAVGNVRNATREVRQSCVAVEAYSKAVGEAIGDLKALRMANGAKENEN